MDNATLVAAYIVIGGVVLGAVGLDGCSRQGVVLIILFWPVVLALALGAFLRGAFGLH